MDSSNERPDRDAQWAEGLRAGDQEVFEDLFRTLYSELVAYAQSIVRREDVAEDVVQEVLIRVWKRGEEWEATDNVTAYAYRAVHNRALNAVRDRSPEEEQSNQRTDEGLRAYVPADRNMHADKLRQAVEETIDDLPDRRRQIFLLSRRHDLTYAEIAEVLDISERTVETQIRRALRALRDCVSQYE